MFVTVPTLDQVDRRTNDHTLNTDHIVSIRHGKADTVGIVMSNGDQYAVPLASIMGKGGKGKFETLMAVLNGNPGDGIAFPVHTAMI